MWADKVRKMKKHWEGNFLYYFGGIILSLFLCVGLIHMISGGYESEPGKNTATKKEETKEKKQEEQQGQEDQDGTVIRVLLKTGGYADEVHPNVSVSAEGGLVLEGAEAKREAKGGETATIAPDDPLFEGGTIRVKPKKGGDKITISSLKRGYGVPSYRGELELFSTAQ